MMQRLALACGAIVAALAAAGEGDKAQCLQDSSQLIQNLAVVGGGEGPQEEKPVTTQIYETVQGELKPSSKFMDVIKEMTKKWKEHKVRQLEETQPWVAKEQRKARAEKEKHRGDRAKPVAEPKKEPVKVLTEEEQKALETEARLAKFGDPMSLIVREPSGREFSVKFRTNTRLQVLIYSVCKKLGVQAEDIVFQHRDRTLDPLATPMSFGLVDQDVVEVDGPKLQAQAQDGAERVQKGSAEMEARLAEKESQQVMQEVMEQRRSAKQLRKARRRAVVEAEEKRQHDLQMKDMVTLKFECHDGGAANEVNLALKRNNWLQGTMDLVTKRMNLDPAKARFYFVTHGRKVLIKPHDSIRELGLQDMETISVTGVGA